MPPCVGALWRCDGQGVWLREEELSSKVFHTLLFLPFFLLFVNHSGKVA